MTHLHLLELVGPLVDDGGAFARTLHEVLAERGLPTRGGAEDLTEGSAPGHAIATALGGHGRDDEDGAVTQLEDEVVRRWSRIVVHGVCRLAPGADQWVEGRLASGGAVGVVSNLPTNLVASLLEGVGLPALAVATGVRGLPHPDAVMAITTAHGVSREQVTVVARSPAVLLAATQAGITELVLLGSGSARWMELVPITARVASLRDLTGPS